MVGACPHPKSPLAGFRLAPRRAAGPAPARRRRPPGPRISGGVALAPQLAGAGCTPQPLIQYFYLLIKHCACLPGQHSAAGRPPDPDIRRWIRRFESGHPAASGAPPPWSRTLQRACQRQNINYLSVLAICRVGPGPGALDPAIRVPGPALPLHVVPAPGPPHHPHRTA